MQNLKRMTFLFLCVCLSIFLTQAQNEKITPSKRYVTKDISASVSFEKINVRGFVDVEYRQSKNPSISVYGSDNLVDLVEVNVAGGELQVSFKKNVSIQGQTRLKVIASSPSLSVVTIKGSSDVYLKENLEGNSLELHIHGSGDIQADILSYSTINAESKGSGDVILNKVKCDSFMSHVQGSGDVSVKGSANNVTLSVNGSGDIVAKDLVAVNVTARVKGSGDIDCYAKNKLHATVAGSGDIKYRGNPADVSLNGNKKQITKK